jgi:hypothetical protein
VEGELMTRPNECHLDDKSHYVFSYAKGNVAFVDRSGTMNDDDVWLEAVELGLRRRLGDPVTIYRQVWHRVDPTTGGKLSWACAGVIRRFGPMSPAEVRDAVVEELPGVMDDPWLKGKIKKALRLNRTFERVRPGVYGLSAYGRRLMNGKPRSSRK